MHIPWCNYADIRNHILYAQERSESDFVVVLDASETSLHVQDKSEIVDHFKIPPRL